MNELKEGLREQAAAIKNLDDEISVLTSRLEDMKSEREKMSDELVVELQATADIEHGEGIRFADIGLVKLETKSYPRLLNLAGLTLWAEENKQVLPGMTINAATLGAWMREQISNSMPLPPEELVKSFLKTRIKINK